MTICAAVKIAEGLVMAADSASMLEGTVDTPQGTQRGVVQTFSFANKVTRIKDNPIICSLDTFAGRLQKNATRRTRAQKWLLKEGARYHHL